MHLIQCSHSRMGSCLLRERGRDGAITKLWGVVLLMILIRRPEGETRPSRVQKAVAAISVIQSCALGFQKTVEHDTEE